MLLHLASSLVVKVLPSNRQVWMTFLGMRIV